MDEQLLYMLYCLAGVCLAIFGVCLCILIEVTKQSAENEKKTTKEHYLQTM
jgi:uncharacterized membrane protein YsdA (DUF1294 family)